MSPGAELPAELAGGSLPFVTGQRRAEPLEYAAKGRFQSP